MTFQLLTGTFLSSLLVSSPHPRPTSGRIFCASSPSRSWAARDLQIRISTFLWSTCLSTVVVNASTCTCSYPNITCLGATPYGDATPEAVFENILAQERYQWPSPQPIVSDEAKEFVERMLQYNPKDRLGTKGAKEIKVNRPWPPCAWKPGFWHFSFLIPPGSSGILLFLASPPARQYAWCTSEVVLCLSKHAGSIQFAFLLFHLFVTVIWLIFGSLGICY